MKGDKGQCIQFINGNMVNKTCFDTAANCTLNIKRLQNISVLGANVKPYKCKKCNFYHSGTLSEIKLYGKNT